MIFVVDEEGNLVYAFWDDATSRNNYKYFGDLISFDSTYSTNQYNMIFAFFLLE
jgi:zinc finger SWIM domain-containing protein 3